MLNKIDANEAPTINGGGSQAYDFIYVEDVARCNVLALQAEAKDEFYNVGTGMQTSIGNLCDMILMLNIILTLETMLEDLFKTELVVLRKRKKTLDFPLNIL